MLVPSDNKQLELTDKQKNFLDALFGEANGDPKIAGDIAGYSHYTVPLKALKDEIKELWDEGKYITSLNYGKGLWLLVMSKIPGYAGQRWFTDPSFPKNKINEGWDAGKFITSLTYGNGQWAVVMTDFPLFTSQSYSATYDFPEEEIQQGWDDGKYITSLNYCNGLWALVMSGVPTGGGQNYSTSYSFPKDKIYRNYFAKGHYFKYSGKAPFSNLIYPVSGQHSLGIHVGFDLAGGMRFGPDVEFVKEIDYSFNESLKSKFIESISQYWPDINPSKLHPDYTGIRPKITKPNQTMRDFSIQTFNDHGIKNLINLQGIESPGLTSSMAIGKLVKNLL